MGDNPLNGTDPTGLCWGPDWACNAVSSATSTVGGAVSSGVGAVASQTTSWAGDIKNAGATAIGDVQHFDYGTAAAGIVNVGYGGWKIESGVALIGASGAALTIPFVGPILSAGAFAGGSYQLVSGTGRIIRGGEEIYGAATTPPTDCSVTGNLQRFGWGLLPRPVHSVWDLLGDLL